MRQQSLERLEFPVLSQPPASSTASPSEGEISGPLYRRSGPRTIRIGERALGNLRWWVTWKAPTMTPCLIPV